MSDSEDYLDGLLNSVANEKKEDVDDKGDVMRSEEDFMKDFENEAFSEADEEAFLKQFEQELLETESDAGSVSEELLFENMDGIVNSVKQESDNKEKTDEVLPDTSGETGDDLSSSELDALVSEISGAEDSSSGDGKEDNPVDSDQELMDLLQSEDGMSDIGDMVSSDGSEGLFEESGINEFSEEELEGIVAQEEEAPAKKKKKGFFEKLSRILFGEEESEAEEETEKVALSNASMPEIEELSDENLEILQTLSGNAKPVEEAPKEETEEEKKAKKAAEKKAKKEKKKEENERKKKEKKAKKEATKAKKEKEKKEKPPKEPDRTPPLPKVPVVLIFVMAISCFALIMLATNLMGYSNSFTEAEDAYNKGNYELAYQQVCGMEIKEADIEKFEKYKVMATVSAGYAAYESFMQQEMYDMALDSLIRTIGRCEKYYSDAEKYGCAGNVENTRAQAMEALAVFGINEEQALNIYHIEKRSEYSKEIYRVMKAAGLELTEEES